MIPPELSPVVRARVNAYLQQRLDNPAFHSRLFVNEEEQLLGCFGEKSLITWLTRFSDVFPQQLKLMGSSAQISSGVCRCGLQEQVPEEGSGRFRRVRACAGVGSGGRFQKVPEGSGVKWCRFRRQVPEGSGRFRRVPVYA